MLFLTVLLSPDFPQLFLSLSHFSLFSAFWDSVSPYSLHEVHIDIKNHTVSEVPVQKRIQRGTARRRLTVEWTELTPHWYQYLITDAASWETKARVWVVAGTDVPRTPGEITRWRTCVSHVHSFHPPFLPLFFPSWDGVWLCFWDWPWAWCSSSGLPASFSLLSSWNCRYISLPQLQLLLF